mmetsp:Transcript_36280/g.79193  ORF Transcript_36280/g.79193 Transcript_36280/m.79193 type:complete len:294 (+) Transcript_36280:580-1461(+)
MLQLQLPVLVELRLVLEGHHAEGVPVAQWRHRAELLGSIEAAGGEETLAVVEGGNVARSQLLDGRLPCKAVLDQHGRDGDHGQASIVHLRRELLPPLRRVLDFAPPVAGAEVARLAAVGGVGETSEGLVLEELGLDDSSEHEDLSPALQRHLSDGCQAARHILKLQAGRRREEAIELAEDVGPDHADGGEHADTAMLELHRTATVKVLLAATLAEADRVPEEEWVASTDLLGGVESAAHHGTSLCRSRRAAQSCQDREAAAGPDQGARRAAQAATCRPRLGREELGSRLLLEQ